MSTDKKTDEVSAGTMVEKYVLAFAEASACPAALKPHLIKAAPILGKLADALMKLQAILIDLHGKAMVQYEKLRPYRLELLVPGFAGLIMCFFGGSFLTLIAAVEAFRMCGYESTMSCVRQLVEDFQKVKEASAKDDVKDEDNDGVKDVLQVSNSELLKRKTLLFLRTVDPNRVALALAGINAGFLAVIATLKMQFAKTITLGNAIGAAVEPQADRFVIPLLEKVFPAEYKKWARPIVVYSIRSTAISIAWFIQRVISAFHSALRGGLMFSRNLLAYLSAQNIIHIDPEHTYLDEIVGYSVSFLGLMFQLTRGFSLPFPLNFLLFPFSLAEYLLIWAVNTVK